MRPKVLCLKSNKTDKTLAILSRVEKGTKITNSKTKQVNINIKNVDIK